MADLNEVRLIGRLTRDPELRSTPTGQYVGKLGLATSRKYRAQDGTIKEDTTFVDITCWGKTAENVGKYLKKGRLVFVGGRLKLDTWDDKQTGQKRYKLHVIADNIQFLDSKKDDVPYGGMPGAYPYTQGQAYPPQNMPFPGQAAPMPYGQIPPAVQPQPPVQNPGSHPPVESETPGWTPPDTSEPPTWDVEPDLGEPPF